VCVLVDAQNAKLQVVYVAAAAAGAASVWPTLQMLTLLALLYTAVANKT